MSSAEQPATDTAARQGLLPWLVAVAFFMEALDTTILNTAVPTIARALGVAPLSMKSVLSSYTLSLAVFIPVSGWMADRFGTRRVFAAPSALFTLGSLLCGLSRDLHWLVACRILQGVRRRDDGAGRAAHAGAHVPEIRAGARHELRRDPRARRPDARAARRRPHRRLPALARHLLRQPADRPRGPATSCTATCRTTASTSPPPLDVAGLVLFGSGIALLSYVLEVFGEHRLSAREMLGAPRRCRCVLLGGYGLHAARTRRTRSCGCACSRIRTFRAAVSGSFFTRIGDRRHAVPAAAALSGRARLHAGSIGPAHDAAGDRRHEPEGTDAADPGALRLPRRAGLEHGDARRR